MTQQIDFIKDEIFHREEGKDVEFKTIESKRPVNRIVDHAEEYIVGFLNASVEGDLYFGIDDSGKILGVTLNRNERDDILKFIPNKVRNIDPVIPQSSYEIYIVNVYDMNKNCIENLFIVRIHIQKIEEEYLYKTSGGSFYLKKGSNCIKLSSEEIAKEIGIRKQKHLIKERKKLDDRLEKDPGNRTLLEKKVEVAKLMNDGETIDLAYKELLKLNPKSSKTRIDHASAHESIGDLEGALSILDHALELNHNDSAILKSRGSTLRGLDRLNEALKSYKAALKLTPEDYTIITQIGITLRKIGNYKESLSFLNYALLKSPKYRVAKYEKKITYSKMFQKK